MKLSNDRTGSSARSTGRGGTAIASSSSLRRRGGKRGGGADLSLLVIGLSHNRNLSRFSRC